MHVQSINFLGKQFGNCFHFTGFNYGLLLTPGRELMNTPALTNIPRAKVISSSHIQSYTLSVVKQHLGGKVKVQCTFVKWCKQLKWVCVRVI